MLCISKEILQEILGLYDIYDDIDSYVELLRCDCNVDKQDSEEFKLYYKVYFDSHLPLVVKFRGGCSERNRCEIIEKQSEFSDILRRNGIPTPKYYHTRGSFIHKFDIDGYHVTVTVEDYMDNEIKTVNEVIAFKTGAVLAAMHNISEKYDCHVPNKVIFDPFAKNDLFSFSEFEKMKTELYEAFPMIFTSICDIYNEKMKILEPLKCRERYAVQGDISDCNTYLTAEGEIGVFDFNCCGDNILFCDAVMQGWFEAHLMNYDESLTLELSEKIFKSFMSEYHSKRQFTKEEKAMIPILYSIIDAFERGMLEYDDNNLKKTVAKKDIPAISEYLEHIRQRLTNDVDVVSK